MRLHRESLDLLLCCVLPPLIVMRKRGHGHDFWMCVHRLSFLVRALPACMTLTPLDRCIELTLLGQVTSKTCEHVLSGPDRFTPASQMGPRRHVRRLHPLCRPFVIPIGGGRTPNSPRQVKERGTDRETVKDVVHSCWPENRTWLKFCRDEDCQ